MVSGANSPLIGWPYVFQSIQFREMSTRDCQCQGGPSVLFPHGNIHEINTWKRPFQTLFRSGYIIYGVNMEDYAQNTVVNGSARDPESIELIQAEHRGLTL